MSTHSYVHDAKSRVRSERKAVEAKVDALDRFVDRVEEMTPAPSPSSTTAAATAVGTVSRASRSTADDCETVRRAFAETVRPHSLDDVDGSESLTETIEAELSKSVAVALAPATETTFSAPVKRAVLSAAGTRGAETVAVSRALEREISELETARTVVETVAGWIASADETPLSDLGFDELRDRHATLDSHRSRCEDVAERRQAFLDGATSSGPEAGVSHRSLVPYLYQDFPVDHPALATVARLDDACRECQRAVRTHLVRRA